ncbi:MAG: helix-turn-helix domain-containing protein [Eubacterium sp.]|nr:helix-turn-helix domain-containing protein [Eubacterium sp.]
MQESGFLGKRLKSLREEKGIRQPEVAEYLNITRQNYSAYETKGTMPPIDALRKLSQFFNVSSDYLIGLSDQRNPNEVYSASNINGSNFVQGNGSVTVGNSGETSQEETELLRIYRELDVRGRAKLLNAAFAIEDENKKEEK